MAARTVRRRASVARSAPSGKAFVPCLVPPPALCVASQVQETVPDTQDARFEALYNRLVDSFGDVSTYTRARQTIANEVSNYLRLGRKSDSDRDIATLEARIRNVLNGEGPTKCTKVAFKRAVADADEWARLYAFRDQLGEQQDREQRLWEAGQRDSVQHVLDAQVQDHHLRTQAASAEDAAEALRMEAEMKQWQEEEARKAAVKKATMQRLKSSVEEQLVERQNRKGLEAALRLQEEQGLYAAMASELKAKMEAEEAAAAKAREDLRTLLLSNETGRALKEKQRLHEQALDRKYARQYAEKLDKEEKARQEQIEKRKEHQNKQAAVAQALPESKRWIDSSLIERNFRAREEAEQRREDERQKTAAAARSAFQVQLAEQIAERDRARQARRADAAAEEAAAGEQYKREAEHEAVARAQAGAKREALLRQLESQMQQALQRKFTAEPAMTRTEREINADTLREMHAAKECGCFKRGTLA